MIKLHVAPGNSKLGNIPNVSGVPGKDCVNCELCIKSCYAMKAWRMYPSVRRAWGENSALVRSDPGAWERQLVDWIRKRRGPVPFFRFNVAGDIVSPEHFDAMCNVARAVPGTKFLVFTKAYRFIHKRTPRNLQVIVSAWEGMRPSDLPKRFRRAYAGDCRAFGERFRKAIRCPGNCETCGMCWQLSKIGRDVRFDIH